MTQNHTPDSRLNPTFDRNSMNAMFGTVLARMDHQDRAMEQQRLALERIERAMADRVSQVEEEVEVLSIWRSEVKGKIVVIFIVASAVGTMAGSIAVAFISNLMK